MTLSGSTQSSWWLLTELVQLNGVDRLLLVLDRPATRGGSKAPEDDGRAGSRRPPLSGRAVGPLRAEDIAVQVRNLFDESELDADTMTAVVDRAAESVLRGRAGRGSRGDGRRRAARGDGTARDGTAGCPSEPSRVLDVDVGGPRRGLGARAYLHRWPARRHACCDAPSHNRGVGRGVDWRRWCRTADWVPTGRAPLDPGSDR